MLYSEHRQQLGVTTIFGDNATTEGEKAYVLSALINTLPYKMAGHWAGTSKLINWKPAAMSSKIAKSPSFENRRCKGHDSQQAIPGSLPTSLKLKNSKEKAQSLCNTISPV